jgi:hypothetical protein
VIYTYLRVLERGCNQGDAWGACGDEYLFKKNKKKKKKVEGPQTCRDVSILRTVNSHESKPIEEREYRKENLRWQVRYIKQMLRPWLVIIEEPRVKAG